MRILRYLADGSARCGVLTREGMYPVAGEHLTTERATQACREGTAVTGFPGPLLAPVDPTTVFGMAHNTGPADRARAPQAFLKAAASVSGPGAAIPLPDGIGRVDAEAELAAVIGVPLWQARPGDVELLGVTIALDVTARQAQLDDPLWTEAKSRQGFTPIGPWLETEMDPTDLAITLARNGETIAEGCTAELARSVPEAVAYLSTLVELRPGDVVLTGAPATVGVIVPGDVVSATISGIGTLTNPVVAAADVPRGDTLHGVTHV